MINKKLFKKLLLFLLLVLILPILTGCWMALYKDQQLFNERIGEDFMVTEFEEWEEKPDLPRAATNYNITHPNENSTIITFDTMYATDVIGIQIDPSQKLKIKTLFSSGSVVLKMTQGELNKSKIEKIEFNNDETKEITLSSWNSGDLQLWFVVTEAENGCFSIEIVD